MLEQVLTSLVEITKDIVGAKVENNKFCVSVHYRNVDEKVTVCFYQVYFSVHFRKAKDWEPFFVSFLSFDDIISSVGKQLENLSMTYWNSTLAYD